MPQTTGPESGQHKNEREISILIANLMSHYWVADELMAAREQQMRDWLDDLGEFPAELVAESCRTWRRTHKRHRPTPGHIRSLCIRQQTEESDRIRQIADQSEAWPRWLADIWGQNGQLQRRRAAVLNEARFLRAEFFRGKPADAIANVSPEQLWQEYHNRYPDEVIERAWELIMEIMDKRALRLKAIP